MTDITCGMGRGIAFGTLASTATLLAGIVLAGAGEPLEWEAAAYIPPIAAFIVLFAFFLITLAALVLGLPLVWLLDRLQAAGAARTGLLGALVGAALFVVPSLDDPGALDPDLISFTLAAIAGGGVTGWVWGGTQQRLPSVAERPMNANRIDDPRMLR